MNKLSNQMKPAKPDIKDELSVKSTIGLKGVRNPVLSYKQSRSGNDIWTKPEYDFSDIERIADIESYLARSFDKKRNLFFKGGYDFVSRNADTSSYIKRRLNQICKQSSTNVDSLLSDIEKDLIMFSNCYLYVVRNNDASGGYPYNDRLTGRRIQPIAGLFIIPAASVEYRLDDKEENITKYRQYIPGRLHEYREFNPKDIIHFTRNKKPGFYAGTPSCLPVLDDIKALRRIEENVEILIVQSIFPIVHYRVGTEESPARETLDGSGNEVEDVARRIQSMPPEGIYVTSERHDIQIKGTEGRALRVESYLEYFKKRVFAGISMSGIDFGEGDTANRATALAISQSLLDEVKANQKLFASSFKNFVIDELLLESGTALNLDDDDNHVYVSFGEIDHFSEIAEENNVIQKWINNVITLKEARRELGLNELSDEEREDLYVHRVTIPATLVSGTTDGSNAVSLAAAENPNTPIRPENVRQATQEVNRRSNQATSGSSGQAGTTRRAGRPNQAPQANGGASTAMSRPSNQFGTSTSPRPSSRDQLEKYLADNNLKDFVGAITQYSKVGVLDPSDRSMFMISLGLFKDKEKVSAARVTGSSFDSGIRYVFSEFGSSIVGDEIYIEAARCKRLAESYIDKAFDEVQKVITKKKEVTKDDIIASVNSIAYRLDFIRRTEKVRSYNWGVISGLRIVGEQYYSIELNEDSEESEVALLSKKFQLDTANLSNIPPWHPNSSITVKRVNNE